MTRTDGRHVTHWYARLTSAERQEYLDALRVSVAMRVLVEGVFG
jgi:hypothetical protein